MKNQLLRTSLLLLVFAAVTWPHRAWPADLPKAARPKIYDESLDGSKQITDALAIAKKENKRVLLQFGANWCGWCHLLHNLFETNKVISERLKADYVVALIDVNQGHNKEIDTKYGHPTRFGLPVIVILDSDGKQLTTKNTAELEEGKQHNPDKVLAFLKEWAEPERAAMSASPRPSPITSEQKFVVQFTGADIPQVLNFYQQFTGAELVVNPQVKDLRARITIRHQNPLPRLEAIALMERELRVQAGVVLKQLDGNRVSAEYDSKFGPARK